MFSIKNKYDNPSNSYQRMLNLLHMTNRENYKWKNLSPQQKADVMDAVTTLGMWASMYAGYLALFADADEDDSWAKIYSRIMNDFSQQYNGWELGKNIFYNSTPVSARKT